MSEGATSRRRYWGNPLLIDGHLACAQYLVSQGADIDAKTFIDGMTARDWAQRGRDGARGVARRGEAAGGCGSGGASSAEA